MKCDICECEDGRDDEEGDSVYVGQMHTVVYYTGLPGGVFVLYYRLGRVVMWRRY